MTETVTVLGAAISLALLLAKLAKSLIDHNYDQSKELLKAKQDIYAERLEGLKTVLNDHRIKLDEIKKELESNSKQLHSTSTSFNESNNLIKKHVESTEKRLKAFESEIIKLTNDLIFVKSKQKGN